MKSVTITEENYKRIFSKLEKFFNHKNIMSWHTYDCGTKKRISAYMPKDPHKPKKYNTTRLYPNPKTKRVKLNSGEDLLVINLDEHNSLTIQIGDTISFLGNRINLKREWIPHSNYKYLYACYQIMGESYKDPTEPITYTVYEIISIR